MQQIDEYNGPHRGTLRIGSFISTSMHWIPKVISYFSSNYPDIEIQITECGHDDMVNGIIDGSMDVVLISDPHNSEIDFIPIVDDL